MILADIGDRIADGSLVLAVPIAIAAGLISFLSPCVLPLVPGYLSFVTGMSGAELDAPSASADGGATPHPYRRILLGSMGFIAGFSFVFVSFGAIFGSFGDWLNEYDDVLTRVFGVVTILLGLLFMGAFGFVGWFNRDVRLHRAPRAGVFAAPLLGAAFAFGWTPCIGPTLAAVLNLAATSDTASAARGAFLALCYCLGLGIPFLATGLAFHKASSTLGVLKRHAHTITVVGGVLLVVIGVLQVSGVWSTIVEWLQLHVSGQRLPI